MNVSLLQSQIALNRAAINSLHGDVLDHKAEAKYCKKFLPADAEWWQEDSHKITKRIAQYVKLQKAWKKQIAEIVSAQRSPFAALHFSVFTAKEASEYLEITLQELEGHVEKDYGYQLESEDGTYDVLALRRFKRLLKEGKTN